MPCIPRQYVLSILPVALVMILLVVFTRNLGISAYLSNRSDPYLALTAPLIGLAVWTWLQSPRPKFSYAACALTLITACLNPMTSTLKHLHIERTTQKEFFAVFFLFLVASLVTLAYRWIRHTRLIDHQHRGKLKSNEARASLFDLLAIITGAAVLAGLLRSYITNGSGRGGYQEILVVAIFTCVLTLMAIAWLHYFARLSRGVALAVFPVALIVSSFFECFTIEVAIAVVDASWDPGVRSLSRFNFAIYHQLSLAFFAGTTLVAGLRLGSSSEKADSPHPDRVSRFKWIGRLAWLAWGLACTCAVGFQVWHPRSSVMRHYDGLLATQGYSYIGWPKLVRISVEEEGTSHQTIYWSNGALAIDILVALVGVLTLGLVVPWFYVRMAKAVNEASKNPNRLAKLQAAAFTFVAFLVLPGLAIGVVVARDRQVIDRSKFSEQILSTSRSGLYPRMGEFENVEITHWNFDRFCVDFVANMTGNYDSRNSIYALQSATIVADADRGHPLFDETLTRVLDQPELRKFICEDTSLLSPAHLQQLVNNPKIQDLRLTGDLPSDSFVEDLLKNPSLTVFASSEPLMSTRVIQESRLKILTFALDPSAESVAFPKSIYHVELTSTEGVLGPIKLEDYPGLTDLSIDAEVESLRIRNCPALVWISFDGLKKLDFIPTANLVGMQIGPRAFEMESTDLRSVDTLIEGMTPDLIRSLDLSHARISRKSLAQILAWSELRHLSLPSCEFEEDAFDSFAQVQPSSSLHSIWIDTGEMSQKNLGDLLAMAPRLYQLKVRCPDVRRLDLRNVPDLSVILLRSCPELDEIRWGKQLPDSLILYDEADSPYGVYQVAGAGFDHATIKRILKSDLTAFVWKGTHVDPEAWSDQDISNLPRIEFEQALPSIDVIKTWKKIPKPNKELTIVARGGDAKLTPGYLSVLFQKFPEAKFDLATVPLPEDHWLTPTLNLSGRTIDQAFVDELNLIESDIHAKTPVARASPQTMPSRRAAPRPRKYVRVAGCEVSKSIRKQLLKLEYFYVLEGDIDAD